jgi:hypothetical protein
MAVEATLLNLPKWMLDKRALNQPKLPMPFGMSAAEGNAVSTALFSSDLDAGDPLPALHFVPVLVHNINDPVDADFVEIYQANGPGVCSFLNYAVKASSSQVYTVEFRMFIDGSEVFTPNSVEIEARAGAGAYSQVIGYVCGVPTLLFKESLVIEKKVTVRSTTSNGNYYKVFGSVYVPV